MAIPPDYCPALHPNSTRRYRIPIISRLLRSQRPILISILLCMALMYALSGVDFGTQCLHQRAMIRPHLHGLGVEKPEVAHVALSEWKLKVEESEYRGPHQNKHAKDNSPEPAIERTSWGNQGDTAAKSPPARQRSEGEMELQPELPLHIEEQKSIRAEQGISGESKEHLDLESRAELLSDLLHIPLEDAVKDEKLAGWEDAWISRAHFDEETFGQLAEPKIDFVYLWVNGSDDDFRETMLPWEQRSVLNDAEGKWLASHGTNRYRDWDELRYSFRSIEKNAGHFRNNIQVLVNPLSGKGGKKQTPSWLVHNPEKHNIQVIAQEEFFDQDKIACLPTFNSLTIENQIFNVPSDVDQFYALSDDMLLGTPHSASDIYSPLFGPVMGFKTNSYSATSPPTDADARRFGEKPFLIYTSWLLNRRFGVRKRKGQSHFGHSLSRTVMREAMSSFPRPELRSACQRFRGEAGFQLYSWYASFHYLIERHREALLWSYIILRSDVDGDGTLSLTERQRITEEIANGTLNIGKSSFRRRHFYHLPAALEKAGLKPPQVNTNVEWTSLDGPVAMHDADCSDFNVDDCLAPGFNTSQSSMRNPVFSSSVIFDRLSRQNPHCGDCLLKIVLHQVSQGLSPLLPSAKSQVTERELVVKALMRYKYTIIDPTNSLFVMVTDADQVDSTLVRHYVRDGRELPGQICLNDDVSTTDDRELQDVKEAVTDLFQGIVPEKYNFER